MMPPRYFKDIRFFFLNFDLIFFLLVYSSIYRHNGSDLLYLYHVSCLVINHLLLVNLHLNSCSTTIHG